MPKNHQNSIIFDGKNIGTLANTGDILVSGKEKVCGTLSHESFGYATQIVDINGDGRLDLIIGAPRLFYAKTKWVYIIHFQKLFPIFLELISDRAQLMETCSQLQKKSGTIYENGL